MQSMMMNYRRLQNIGKKKEELVEDLENLNMRMKRGGNGFQKRLT